MSKEQRLDILRRNISDTTNGFESIDREYAFAVWVVEKEFNVGPVTEDFLLMKFWNLFDDYNVETYKAQSERAFSKDVKTIR